MVVDCENSDLSIEEDYIDLKPILNNLYMDPIEETIALEIWNKDMYKKWSSRSDEGYYEGE